MYYFDSICAQAPRPCSLQKYQEACQELWAHPASVHRLGQEVLTHLHSAYLDLVYFFGANQNDTILFCNSPEEAIAQAIQGVWIDYSRPSGRNHFLTTAIDEAPIILNLEKISALGASHDLVLSSSLGQVDLEALRESIHPRTQMICLSWANSLTGVIQPVEEIAKLCQERGILLMLEASSLAGLYEMSLSKLQPDFVCYSGGSLGSVAGSAALWIRSPRTLSPLLPCGHDWMHSTASHPAALLALAAAAKEAREQRDSSLWHLSSLKSHFETLIKESCGPVDILFESSPRLVHVSAIAFHGVHGELLNWHLNRKQLFASFGGGMRQQMHYLLKACLVNPKLQHSALSFSFSAQMSLPLVQEAVQIISECVKELRGYHHFKL